MKKFLSVIMVALMLIIIPFSVSGCNNNDDKKQSYNVIATVASIPPVIASLESIQNGYETYAWIGRGKTYSGINNVEQFNNIGFDTKSNTGTVLTEAEAQKVTSTIELIMDRDENAFINLYCVDFNAYAVYAIAMQAGLNDNQFKIIMIEDGSGAYSDIQTYYINGFDSPESVYQNYLTKVDACNQKLAEIKANHGHGEKLYKIIDHEVAIALASNPNFEFLIQSKPRLTAVLNSNANIAGSKLYSTFGIVDSSDKTTIKANIKFKEISNYVSELTPKQKETYLNLMFGDDRQKIAEMFSRTTVGEITVPSNKLVFIGTRVKSSNYNYVDNLTSLDDFMQGYDSLSITLKEVFSTEEDYERIVNILNASNNSNGAKLSALNAYVEYVYILNLTKALYGTEYDILFKGHPAEIVDDISTWQDVNYMLNEESYKQLEYNMVNSYYSSDTIGKTIGILPGGVAAENFAYISGSDFAIAGLPSSTYTGYEKSTIIEFIITSANETLKNQSNVSARYQEGSLVWQKGEDANYTTLMLNRGNVYKALQEYYASTNAELASMYQTKLNNWLIANGTNITAENVNNYTVNRIGEIVEK